MSPKVKKVRQIEDWFPTEKVSADYSSVSPEKYVIHLNRECVDSYRTYRFSRRRDVVEN